MKKKTFLVSVEKRMYATGQVKVKAFTPEDAIQTIDYQIANGKLQTSAVEWTEPTYEDCTFGTTGDVD